ncbi:MAG TPA: molybdopterin-dependent oxidoreductase [Steroidobacteraceae bacterium]|nr:molybdopterin-dependent oxidoreductase [Steroidobacteraceae bacterium]
MNGRDDSADRELRSQRRRFLRQLGLAATAIAGKQSRGGALTATQPFSNGERELVAYPQKRPLLRITTRPPHLETPFAVFNEGVITPNDAFFVRYHLANIPLSVDLASFRLLVRGKVATELSLSMQDLQSLGTPTELVAVNQCSGNSRGFSRPRVFGAQLGNGSMGNARWVGIRLKTVLDKAGVAAGATQVTFNGLDTPVLPGTPDFIKALDIEVATAPDVLLAWHMNGDAIPVLNGYPLRLVVPGYFGTYWVKHLSEITVIDTPFTGHDAWFMTTAYRLPDNECACVAPGAVPAATRPILKLKLRSFVTSLADDAVVRVGQRVLVKGIAFDGGSGIKKVELSENGGARWREASLGPNLGRYSFREWTLPLTPARQGPFELRVRATAASGETQPSEATWNPGGYARNGIESMRIVAV